MPQKERLLEESGSCQDLTLPRIGSERLVAEIADSKSNVLSRREVNTDPRGFAAVEFPLPAQRSQAVYELRVKG